jgi:hypothetical protein
LDASAGFSHGKYRLTRSGRAKYIEEKKTLPSCGESVNVALSGIESLDVDYHGSIIVNGRNWKIVIVRDDVIVAEDPEPLSGATLRLTIMHSEKITRASLIAYLDDGKKKIRCADASHFNGTYTRA